MSGQGYRDPDHASMPRDVTTGMDARSAVTALAEVERAAAPAASQARRIMRRVLLFNGVLWAVWYPTFLWVLRRILERHGSALWNVLAAVALFAFVVVAAVLIGRSAAVRVSLAARWRSGLWVATFVSAFVGPFVEGYSDSSPAVFAVGLLLVFAGWAWAAWRVAR